MNSVSIPEPAGIADRAVTCALLIVLLLVAVRGCGS